MAGNASSPARERRSSLRGRLPSCLSPGMMCGLTNLSMLNWICPPKCQYDRIANTTSNAAIKGSTGFLMHRTCEISIGGTIVLRATSI